MVKLASTQKTDYMTQYAAYAECDLVKIERFTPTPSHRSPLRKYFHDCELTLVLPLTRKIGLPKIIPGFLRATSAS